MFSHVELMNLIEDYGQPLTWSSKGPLTYNVTTSVATNTSTSITVMGYFFNYHLGDVDGMSVVLGDRRLALPTKDTGGNTITAPKKGDTFTGEEDMVSVVRVDRIMSGVDPVGYVCQVRE